MLRRAKRLSTIFTKYCIEHGQPQFRLNAEEWRQIDYLLCITQPFYKWTTGLSKVKDVTIHNVFRVYNKLFEHLEKSICQLKRKKVKWKTTMREALEAGSKKLSVYYNQTENIHGNLYAIGTILAPQYKLHFFSKPDWSDDNYRWRATYREYIERYIEPYKQRQLEGKLPQNSLPSSRKKDDMELLFDDDEPPAAPVHSHPNQTKASFDDELTHYLDSGMYILHFTSSLLTLSC